MNKFEFRLSCLDDFCFRHRSALACVALLLVPVLIFLPYLTGAATFIGDSDRLNHTLALLNIDVQNIREGTWAAWNDRLFGGHSIVAWPYYFRSPYPYLALLWPEANLFDAAAVISTLILAVAGWCAFLFVRQAVGSVTLAFAGAVLYETSGLAVLKISQDFVTVSSMGLYALALLFISRARPGVLSTSFLGLALVLIGLVEFTFLQNAAYVLPVLGLYALYRAVVLRAWPALVTLFASGTAAAFAIFPWMFDVFRDYALTYRNYGPSGRSNDFDIVYASQGVQSGHILRWLDDRIFGKSFTEAMAFGNSINLHEGVLNYTTTFFALLVIVGIVIHCRRLLRPKEFATPDIPFFVCLFLATMLIVATRTGYWLIFQAYFRIDLIHTRVLLVSILPGIVVGMAFLRRWASDPLRAVLPSSIFGAPTANVDDLIKGKLRLIYFGGGTLLAFMLIAAIEAIARLYTGDFFHVDWPFIVAPRAVSTTAALRILLSAALSLTLVAVAWQRREDPSLRRWFVVVFAMLMVGQGFAFAREGISGEHMSTDAPFNPKNPVRVKAPANEFRLPSPEALERFHERLETDSYRTSILCSPDVTFILCSPHIANFWRWRVIEGYLSGVPARLAAFPWPSGTLWIRQINFRRPKDLPWPLLGLFNVKYAVGLTSDLMTNRVRETYGTYREVRPSDVKILENPEPVVPRVFFVHNVTPVPDVAAAVRDLFPRGNQNATVPDVASNSYVESYPAPRTFPVSGSVMPSFHGDRVDLRLDPSADTRFLVLNERYHPDWHAYAGATELRIYPTNGYMRGIEIPPGVTNVTLRYEPFVQTAASLPFYGVSLLLCVLGSLVFRRYDRRST